MNPLTGCYLCNMDTDGKGVCKASSAPLLRPTCPLLGNHRHEFRISAAPKPRMKQAEEDTSDAHGITDALALNLQLKLKLKLKLKMKLKLKTEIEN